MGIYFYPRGGSSHACRSIARELEANGLEVTLLAGSRPDLGEAASASAFYTGLDVRPVEFAPVGDVPIHGSYEDRPGAPDRVLASFDDDEFERQVEAWTGPMTAAAEGADVLYLHHLTPLNEVAARSLPRLPVVGHVHGTELLMLEQIEAGAPSGWTHAEAWAERLRGWAARCARIVVNDRGGLERAAPLLGLEVERFVCIPNGVDPIFTPGPIDRRAFWHRHLDGDLTALEGVILLAVGRFTEVKRLPLLVEAFAKAQDQLDEPAALVLIGGHPGEWEGEHPLEAIARTGARNVFLAGWHGHEELPSFLRAGDLLVHASVREQFGAVLIEAMACGLPVIAFNRGGPATIVDDPETGWLVEPGEDDAGALAAAIVAAVSDGEDRHRRGARSREEAVGRYSWSDLGKELAELVRLAS
jgi:glycosyltransferase involved in cell wall biosynthesis